MLDDKGLRNRIFLLFPNKSQSEIGATLGVSQRLVSNWKVGRCTPKLEELAKIVDVSHCSWDWLMTGHEDVTAESCGGRLLRAEQVNAITATTSAIRSRLSDCQKCSLDLTKMMDQLKKYSEDPAEARKAIERLGGNHD